MTANRGGRSKGERVLERAQPSRTAYRVALRRAAHQVFDDPVVFRDPLALRILGMDASSLRSGALRAPERPWSRSLRAFVVARSRFAEDALAAAVAQGCRQYVLLGAGLDTFACRNPYATVRTFEVDHPATQAWKRDLLDRSGIAVPESCAHVPVDFERGHLLAQLQAAGFLPGEATLFAWLGVLPYLTGAGTRHTLNALARLPAPNLLVLDYSLPREMLPPDERRALDSLAMRVAAVGEPFRQFFTPEGIAAELQSAGFTVVQDWNAAGINARYFAGEDAGLRVLSTGGHLLLARRSQACAEITNSPIRPSHHASRREMA